MFNANLNRRSYTDSLPASIGGLNDINSISEMGVGDALLLENWFPSTNSCEIRGGALEYASNLPGIGETLLAYNGIASSKLFVAAGSSICDITTSGAVVNPIAINFNSARWDYVNFGGAAGNFLVAVNGVDLPQFYNGTEWAASGGSYATAITGIDSRKFSQVNVWKNRLFFVEKNSLKCWYLGTQAIGGAATAFDFSGVAKLGGKLIATATVSTNAGNGQDDFFVAITSEGELLVYQGTDPSNINSFGLVGNFRIGRPIANGNDNQGSRFLCRFSNALLAITIDGIVNIYDAINSDVVAKQQILNQKIINTINKETAVFKQNFGWQTVLVPSKNQLYINIPSTELLHAHQYVMNTITGAWCKFTGWDCTCLAYWQDNLYGVIGNKVYLLNVPFVNDFATATSIGNPITASVKTSFQFFGGKGQHKHYKMVRPLFFSTGIVQPFVKVETDFSDKKQFGTGNITSGNEAVWDTAIWDEAVWGSNSVYTQRWLSITGFGYSAALKMSVTVSQQTCSWQGWDIIYEPGGLI